MSLLQPDVSQMHVVTLLDIVHALSSIDKAVNTAFEEHEKAARPDAIIIVHLSRV